MPVSTPVNIPTAATGGVALDHVPPASLFISVTVPPAQTLDGPLIGEGMGLTVSECILEQPVAVMI
jgi:hypothetical protein